MVINHGTLRLNKLIIGRCKNHNEIVILMIRVHVEKNQSQTTLKTKSFDRHWFKIAYV